MQGLSDGSNDVFPTSFKLSFAYDDVDREWAFMYEEGGDVRVRFILYHDYSVDTIEIRILHSPSSIPYFPFLIFHFYFLISNPLFLHSRFSHSPFLITHPPPSTPQSPIL